jgi:hypothetical protein
VKRPSELGGLIGRMLVFADSSTTWIAVGSVGTFVAALATTGLALLTRRVAAGTKDVASETRDLAGETRKLAAATETSARAARDAVEAMEEPFVIAVPMVPTAISLRGHESQPPPGIHRALGGPEGPFVRMRLWNIGSGPAIVEHVILKRSEQADCLGPLPGGFRPIGAGQAADLEIPSPSWPAVLGDGILTITYTHASGRRYQTRSDASIGDPVIKCLTYARSRV